MELYPPPDGGAYPTPWLWLDGRSRGWEYQYWRGYVEAQMAAPADVGITLDGSFDPGSRTGNARAVFTNSSGQAITANARMALTEDSVYYFGTNGDYWHNHVCRDYLPDENGTTVALAPGGSDTVLQSFTLEDSWDAARCNIVVYLQGTELQPDSSLTVHQGGIAPVLSFSGAVEPRPTLARRLSVRVSPNPCRTGCVFTMAGVAREGSVTIYAADGRLVSRLEMEKGRAVWNRAEAIPRGIYLYRACAGAARASGRIAVVD